MKQNLPKAIDLTQICKNGAKTTHCFEQTHLFNLSDEVLVIIFKNLKRPLDQIAFLLTCKKTAAVFSNIPLNRTLKAVRRWRRRVLVDYQHEHLVADMAKWKRFIPPDTKLCHQCWKWLPYNRNWKETRTNRDITTLKHVDWMWMIARWKSAAGRLCPSCQISEDFQEGEEWLQPWPENFGRGPIVRQRLPNA